MRKRFCLGLLSAVLLLSLCSCRAKPQELNVTINSSGNYIVATMVIIKEEKLMEKYLPEGYTVNWTSVITSTEIRDGMLTGDINIASPAVSTTISALENGIPFRIMSYMCTPVYKMYSAQETIQSIDDVGPEDRISITGYSGSMHLAFLTYCKDHFGAWDQLAGNLVVMPNGESLASLESGSDISVGIYQFANNLLAEKSPAIHCIGDISEAARKYGVGQVCVTTEEYYRENPQVIEAFLNAQEEAIRLFYDQPEYVADLLIRSGINVEKEALLKAMPDSGPSGVFTAEQYNGLAQFMYEAEMLSKEPKKLEEYDFYDALMENNKRYE